jgi:N-acetylmuramic acid 6-phosphate etherase
MARDLEHLITEARNQRTAHIDVGTSLEIIRTIQKEDIEILRAVRRVRKQMAKVVNTIAEALRSGGRLFYVGAGTSGRLGVLDAAECPPTYGTRPETIQGIIAGGPRSMMRSAEGKEDRPELGKKSIQRRKVRRGDIVFGITASGSTPFVLAALAEARRRGASTILLTFNPTARPDTADLILAPVVGPEVVTGSTRMKAGTATKLILNTISTATMIRLGKTYGNLMVDLRATNVKLRNRACRIVMGIAGVDRDTASGLLRRAGGETKVAIVMSRCGVSPSKARHLLAAKGGILRKVIDPG